MFLKSLKLLWMVDVAGLDPVQHIEFRIEGLCECNRDSSGVRCFNRAICGVEDSFDLQSPRSKDINVWPYRQGWSA